ncbi:DNA polymerase III subunit gamma/tau, partial [Actinokineospora sp. PR83]|nr:DNA polymerase III subunit gamma/tau [Actinokineospora sp. PR83]
PEVLRPEPARPEPARPAAPEAPRPEPARAEAPRKNADGSQYVRPSQRAAAQPAAQPERTTPDRPTPERSAPQRPTAPQPTPAGSSPAQAPAPGGLDAAAVRRVWSELLATIRNTSKRTAALLATATVQTVEGDTLVIAHAAAPLARLLAETSNTDAIAQALVTLFGGTWKVRCIHADPSSAPDTGTAAPPRAQAKATPERTFEPPRRASRPVEQLPPEPPAEDIPPPPEPEDEEEMLAQAAHKPDPDAPRQDPEAAMLKLLAEKLGARPVEG